MNSKGDENGNGKAMVFRIMEVATTFLSTVVAIVVVPFGVWAVQSIQALEKQQRDFLAVPATLAKIVDVVHKLEIQQAEFNQWKNVGPRFTTVDAENLRYKILAEVQERVDKRLEAIDVKLTKLTDAIAEHLIRENTRGEKP